MAPAERVRPNQQTAVIEKHLALSRDGTLLAISMHTPANRFGSTAGTKAVDETKLWNLTTGQAVLSFEEPHHVSRMVVSPDGKTLFSVGWSPNTDRGEFKIWDLNSGKVRHRKDVGVPAEKSATGFSPDGRLAYLLLGATLTHELGIVDVETGNIEHMRMPQSQDQATAAAFSPISDTAAIGIVVTRAGGRCAIDIHDLKERKIANSLLPGNTVQELNFSGDGRLLAGSAFGKIVAWETTEWSQVASYPAATSLHQRVAVSDEGRFVAALLNGKVEIYDVTTKNAVPLNVPFACLDMAFTPGGTLIVAPQDLRFVFFDPESGNEQLTPLLKPKS